METAFWSWVLAEGFAAEACFRGSVWEQPWGLSSLSIDCSWRTLNMSVSLWLWGYSRPGQTVLDGFQINTTGSEAVNRGRTLWRTRKPVTLNFFYVTSLKYSRLWCRSRNFNAKLKASSAEIKRLSRNCSSERGFGFKLGLPNGVQAHWHFVDADKGDSKTNGVIMG